MSTEVSIKKQIKNRIIRSTDVSEIFAKDLTNTSIDHVSLYLETIIGECQYAKRFVKMEQNLAAKQEALKVAVGIWCHWKKHPNALEYYNPQKKTLFFIEDIKDDLESFLILVLDKYWSTLGSSVRNKNLPKVYYSKSGGGNNE